MQPDRPFFFCGIGGSGMLPLALIMRARGHTVLGSDRSRDQGRTPEKFGWIESQGIKLFPQDGTGVTADVQNMIISSAVEENVPDYIAAQKHKVPITIRAALLAQLFNTAPQRIGIAGTSGKSTTTGMIGWIAQQAGQNPTVMNGAIMKNFVTDANPYATALAGGDQVFISETDESDGSIALFHPTIAVLNNITLDHKPLDELRVLFGGFIAHAHTAVLNMDNAETARLAIDTAHSHKTISYSLHDNAADFYTSGINHTSGGVFFKIHEKNSRTSFPLTLHVPGLHNVSNALAAIAAAKASGIAVADAVTAMEKFSGIRRRLEVVGHAHGITVIDDFAQNPDKIAASIRALHAHGGRLLLIFQPHGYGVNNRDRAQFIDCFADALGPDDVLFMPDPLYLGGTVTPTYLTSDVVTGPIAARGKNTVYKPTRQECAAAALAMAQAGDRIVVMGARDDTLSAFATEILSRLS